MISEKTLEMAEKELDRLCKLGAYFKYSSAGPDGVHRITDGHQCYTAIPAYITKRQNEVFIDCSVWPIYNKEFYNRNKDTFTDAVILRYIRWLTNKSIFNKAFVSKTAERIQKRGAIFDAAYPAYYVISAATALRYISENPEIVAVWDIFRKYINYNQAFYLAHFFRQYKENNGIVGVMWECSSPNSNHILPPPKNIDISGRKPCLDRDAPMSENASYAGLGRIWDEQPIRHFYMLKNSKPPQKNVIKQTSIGKDMCLPYYPLDTLGQVLRDTVKHNASLS